MMEESDMDTSKAAKRRIGFILDAGSFMEMGENILARNTESALENDRTYSDGVVTGYGTVEGRPIYIFSQEPQVLGGSLSEMHAGKILRLYEMALKTGAPVIALTDSAGLRLSEGVDALDAYGRIYRGMTKAKGRIPQIAGVFGHCGGGSALIPALCDFVFMEKQANLFITPPSARTADTKRADMPASLADYPAGRRLSDGVGDEAEICGRIRELITYLPLSCEDAAPWEEPQDDANRAAANLPAGVRDPRGVLSQIADADSVFELQKEECPEVTVCFARFNGRTAGVAGNAGEGMLTAEACEIMADFADFCTAFGLPLLTLTDTEGFSSSSAQEPALPSAASYLLSVWASSEVPRINVITGKASGSAYTIMNSKGLGADFVFAWPDARIQVFPGEDAARILYAQELATAGDKRAFLSEKAAEYEGKTGTAAFVARGHIDKVIAPADTRKYVIGALEMLSDKREY
jgi:acetyl-CoA carboxylase carboxyltransferase component